MKCEKVRGGEEDQHGLLVHGTYLGLWIDLGAALFEDLSDVDLVLLSTQVHRRQSVLGLAVGVGAAVEQNSRDVSVAERRRQMQRTVTILRNTRIHAHRVVSKVTVRSI